MGGRTKTPAPSSMSLHEHLKEFRNGLFGVSVFFILFSALGYTFRNQVLAILLSPLQGERLSYLTPGGGFTFIFSIIMWCGVAGAIPVALFALYRFLTPALPERAQSKSGIVLVSSLFLMVCGALFGYFFAIPGAIRFLLGFADEYVQAMLTADSYLSFMLAYTVGLGMLFQIPLLLVIINWIKPLKPMKLLAFERWVILASFVAAALITPTPDVVNQCVIALPIVALYQVGVAIVWYTNFRQERREKKLQKNQTQKEGQKRAPAASAAAPTSHPTPSSSARPKALHAADIMATQPTVKSRPQPLTAPKPTAHISKARMVATPKPVATAPMRPQGMSLMAQAGYSGRRQQPSMANVTRQQPAKTSRDQLASASSRTAERSIQGRSAQSSPLNSMNTRRRVISM